MRYCQKATKKSKQLIRMQRVQVFSDWCQLVSHHSKVGGEQVQYLHKMYLLELKLDAKLTNSKVVFEE